MGQPPISLTGMDRDHLNRLIIAAMTRFVLPSGDPVPERERSVDVLRSASFELCGDAAPDVEKVYAALVVAYSDLRVLPDTDELRKSILALAWQFLGRRVD